MGFKEYPIHPLFPLPYKKKVIFSLKGVIRAPNTKYYILL
jgi:hypothetical protein